MPGCSPLQVIAISEQAPAGFSQLLEKTRLRSKSRAPAARSATRQPASPDAAHFAGRNSAVAWRARYLEWMETNLPRTSTRLLARLPFDDAIKLAALVGTGRMTWPEINAALDAMIKVAAADALDGCWDEHDLCPTGSPAGRISEDEIWARYHAQCDEVFGRDGNSTDTGVWSRDQLWRTERILDRLRSVRDRDLAALRRYPSAQPSQTVMSQVDLSPAESGALGKLEATGFVASEGMVTAIDGLVSEIVESAVPLNAAYAAAPACPA